MAKRSQSAKSPSSSNSDSDSEANRLFEESSSNAYNWRSKFTANVRKNNSKSSRRKPKAPENQTDTSVEQRSADSEK